MSGTLYLGPGPGQPWPLSIAAVETILGIQFPGARFVHRTNPINGHDILRFDLDMSGGETRKGTFSSGGVLALSEGTPDAWADTIAWYLTQLPAGTTVYALVEESATDPTPDTGRRDDPSGNNGVPRLDQ